MASWADLIGPAVQTAGGWYAQSQEKADDQKRSQDVMNDPGYKQAGQLQSQLLTQASGNPDEMAAKRFQAQQGLMAPVYDKGQNDLMRDLFRKGMLGLATSEGADAQGNTWTVAPGQQVNPMMAAFQSAKMANQSKAAYDAMREGQQFQTNAISNASNLGAQRKTANDTVRAAAPQISKSAGRADLFKGIGGMLTNPAVTGAIGKLFSGGFGGGGAAAAEATGQNLYGLDNWDRMGDLSAFGLGGGGMMNIAPLPSFDIGTDNWDLMGNLGSYGFGGWDGGWSTGDNWSF